MGRISKSFAITLESWQILRSEKSLMLFPLISAAASVLVFLSFAVPVAMVLIAGGADTDSAQAKPALSVVWFLLAFVFYFISFSVANYFNVALIGCALEKFEGRPVSLGIGLRIANSRLPQILMWSAVAATVGVILKAIQERAGFLGKIIIGLIGMAWAIATFFVIPILVIEGLGPIAAVKRSASIIKQTWGEALVARVSVSLVTGLAMVLTVAVTVGLCVLVAMTIDSIALVAAIAVVGVAALLLVTLIGTTLKEIVNAALYRYATTGAVAPGFSASSLQGIFEPKRK
jgi:hypothetical protein